MLWQLIVHIDLKLEKLKLTISAKSFGIFDFFLQKCSLCSPLCLILLLLSYILLSKSLIFY